MTGVRTHLPNSFWRDDMSIAIDIKALGGILLEMVIRHFPFWSMLRLAPTMVAMKLRCFTDAKGDQVESILQLEKVEHAYVHMRI